MLKTLNTSKIHSVINRKGVMTNIIGASALLLFSMSSSAITINDALAGSDNGTDVGLEDTFEGFSYAGSSDQATELAWINSILDPDVQYSIKTETVDIFDTSDDDIRTFALKGTGSAPIEYPEFFLVKNSQYRALFANTANLAWGVIDVVKLQELADDALLGNNKFNLTDSTISHVTEYSDGLDNPYEKPVPAPTPLLLLGLGLIGFPITRKKAVKK